MKWHLKKVVVTEPEVTERRRKDLPIHWYFLHWNFRRSKGGCHCIWRKIAYFHCIKALEFQWFHFGLEEKKFVKSLFTQIDKRKNSWNSSSPWRLAKNREIRFFSKKKYSQHCSKRDPPGLGIDSKGLIRSDTFRLGSISQYTWPCGLTALKTTSSWLEVAGKFKLPSSHPALGIGLMLPPTIWSGWGP